MSRDRVGIDLWGVAALGFAAVVTAVVVFQPLVPPSWLFRDPLYVAAVSGDCCRSYYGAASNLGVLVWTVGASVAAAAAFVLWRRGADRNETLFFAAAAILTGAVAVDDLYMVHEIVLPRLGVPQTLILAAYGAAGVAYLVVFRKRLLASGGWAFLLAIVALGLSIGVDAVIKHQPEAIMVAEDAAKFFGSCLWSAFHVRIALEALEGDRRAQSG